MKLLNKFVNCYAAKANTGLLGKLFYSNLNPNSFQLFIKFQIIGFFICLAPTIFFYSRLPLVLFFLCTFSFILAVSLLAIYYETWRYRILNTNNAYENTIYILYFLIYTGLFGSILSGWICWGILFKTP